MKKISFLLLIFTLGVSHSSQAHAFSFFSSKKPKVGRFVPQGDGHLALHNIHLNETVDVDYREGKAFDKDALCEISNALRCRMTKQVKEMPVALLDLVDQIQDHFGGKTVEVISGFRSPEFNKSLLEGGHHVASNSLHTHGMAMDIRIPGVTTEELKEYALSLGRGGVGYYPQNGFVHVDIGRVRTWVDGVVPSKSKSAKLAGVHKASGKKVAVKAPSLKGAVAKLVISDKYGVK